LVPAPRVDTLASHTSCPQTDCSGLHHRKSWAYPPQPHVSNSPLKGYGALGVSRRNPPTPDGYSDSSTGLTAKSSLTQSPPLGGILREPHKVVALIMAGGRGRRLGGDLEKPMVKLGGRPMIEWVAHSTIRAGCVSRLIVCASPNTPLTARHAGLMGLEVFSASGRGYVEDLVEAIRTLRLGVVLVLPSDTPLVRPSTLRSLVSEYFRRGATVLTLCVPKADVLALGAEPKYSVVVGGRELCPVGISVLDGLRLHYQESSADEDYLVWRDAEELLNVNTLSDLRLAEKLLHEESGAEGNS